MFTTVFFTMGGKGREPQYPALVDTEAAFKGHLPVQGVHLGLLSPLMSLCSRVCMLPRRGHHPTSQRVCDPQMFRASVLPDGRVHSVWNPQGVENRAGGKFWAHFD